MLIIQCQVSMLHIEQLRIASSSIQLTRSSQCKLADLTTKDQNQNQIGNPSQRDKIDFLKLSRAWMHFAPFLWAGILAAQTLISCHLLIRRGKYYFTKRFIVIEEQNMKEKGCNHSVSIRFALFPNKEINIHISAQVIFSNH